MASRGSVIPLFVEQIKENKNITITDPRMTRFLMSLDDLVDLVIHAFKNANQRIFLFRKHRVHRSGFGLSPEKLFNSDAEVKIIGRVMEKNYMSPCPGKIWLKPKIWSGTSECLWMQEI